MPARSMYTLQSLLACRDAHHEMKFAPTNHYKKRVLTAKSGEELLWIDRYAARIAHLKMQVRITG